MSFREDIRLRDMMKAEIKSVRRAKKAQQPKPKGKPKGGRK